MNNLKNMRCFEIKYFWPTNTKGSRVKIKDLRFNKSKIINYDYKYNNIYDTANDYLNKIWIKTEFITETKTSFLILSSDFENSINLI